jgi:hypothetical protein
MRDEGTKWSEDCGCEEELVLQRRKAVEQSNDNHERQLNSRMTITKGSQTVE